jgi:hexosaminidase
MPLENGLSNCFSENFPWLDMSPAVLFARCQDGLGYAINASTRIFISDEQLHPLALRLAYGFTGAAELTLPPDILRLSETGAQPDPGDVTLELTVPDTLDVQIPFHGKAETYRIDITQSIHVTAQNLDAMARALTTLHKAARVSTLLDSGVIIDAPAYAERSVMIDMGRRQFSPDWVICLIKEMAWNQLNTLHLHLTDNEGVRVIFPSHPDISSDDAWSAADLKRVLDTAAAYHIEVIPELDMPGHMDWILRDRPQWQLKLNNGPVVSKAIDFSIAQARNFLKSLFTDLMVMFPQSRYIHLGADEYFLQPITPRNTPQLAQYVRDKSGNLEADSEDAVRYFVNSMAELVQEKGKIARIWNDSAVKRRHVVALKKQVQIECWSIWGNQRDDLNTQELVDAGYTVLNAHGDFYFIINKTWDNLFHAKHSPHGIYDVWRGNHFMDNAGTSFTEIPLDHPAMAGAGIQLWIEVPTFSSPEEMWTQLRSWLLPLGQRTWDSPNAANRFKELSLIALAVATPPPAPW